MHHQLVGLNQTLATSFKKYPCKYSPKGLTIRDRLQTDTIPIAGIGKDSIAPPSLDGVDADLAVLRILKADNN